MLNGLEFLNGSEFLNESQGRGAPTRRARLRGERSCRRAAPAEKYYISTSDIFLFDNSIYTLAGAGGGPESA